MDFESLKKSPIVWLIAILLIVNVAFYAFSIIVVEKTADRVIEKLQKEYSPGEGYGPKLDPDKVHPDALKKRSVMKVGYTEEGVDTTTRTVPWEVEWENQRF